MSCAFDNRHQYKRTSTKSTIDLVFFSTMINGQRPWSSDKTSPYYWHCYMEAKQCAPPSGKHSTSQAISIHLSTAMNVTFTQWHWLPHPCIQHRIVHSWWLQMKSSTNFFWQQKHSLSSFTNRLLVIQEDPFLAHYSTLLNNALTGSRVPVTTFMRLVIANIATNS